jgi:hypothetical protein
MILAKGSAAKTWSRCQTTGLVVGLLSFGISSPASAESILERVLVAIADMGDGSPLTGIFANIAETVPGLTAVPRRLSAGDEVIVGYDANGAPVTATAGLTGVQVDSTSAAQIATGLAAGFYPIGSQLYQLPPAGQLSLWQSAQDGAALDEARTLLASRIDGRINVAGLATVTNDVDYVALASVATDEASRAAALGQSIQSTVLGVSNSGTVLTGLSAIVDPVDLSAVRYGLNVDIRHATSGAALAISEVSTQLGGQSDSRILALNVAANVVDVTGAIRIDLAGVSMHIDDVRSTVLGAVNGGSIVSGGGPDPN